MENTAPDPITTGILIQSAVKMKDSEVLSAGVNTETELPRLLWGTSAARVAVRAPRVLLEGLTGQLAVAGVGTTVPRAGHFSAPQASGRLWRGRPRTPRGEASTHGVHGPAWPGRSSWMPGPAPSPCPGCFLRRSPRAAPGSACRPQASPGSSRLPWTPAQPRPSSPSHPAALLRWRVTNTSLTACL